MPTYSATEIAALTETASLVYDIINLSDKVKELTTLLDEKKKRLAEILPEGGFRMEDANDPKKALEAKWNDKITKTVQKALVEQNHGITLTDEDFKQTASHYVSVARVKA